MQTSRQRTKIGAALALLACLMGAPAWSAEQSEPLDLEGTWYLLVHYTDSSSANPEVMRWLDLVWTFERKGTRLQWTEYPIVVFEDQSGRFEAIAGNPRSRVLGAWVPNPGQRRTIQHGPHVNRRGSRTKTLRGSDEQGWRSPRRRSQTSAMVMSYQEILTIEQLAGLPVFLRHDIVGGTLTKSEEGGSTYRVTERKQGDRLLLGSYRRDDIKRGRFRLWRTAPARELIQKKRKTQAELIQAEIEDLVRRAEAGDPEAIRILEDDQPRFEPHEE